MSKVVFTRTTRVECGLGDYLEAAKRANEVKAMKYILQPNEYSPKMPSVDELKLSLTYMEFKNLFSCGYYLQCIGEYAPNDTRENRQYFLLGLKKDETNEFFWVAVKERDLQVAVQGYED